LDALPELVRWEATLLAELGYGLDLERCALTGGTDDLAYISPRTGRAVARAAAGIWEARLLRLPAFLIDADAPAAPADLRDGLRLTGHFLARDAFGQRHRPLPAARTMLADKAEAWAAEREPMADGSPAAG
jgi:DNA repair protein RecO (recombination protein O)